MEISTLKSGEIFRYFEFAEMKEPDISNSKQMKPFAHLPGGRFSLEVRIAEIIPISLREANRFIEKHHRHSGRAQGCKFCVALSDGHGTLHGVAVVGRPISRYLDDGRTAEVTRLCTDGILNGCSFLYGCCARIAREMGFRKIITYTLAEENGASLAGPPGWLCAPGTGRGGWKRWNAGGRPRAESRNTGPKRMYYKELR